MKVLIRYLVVLLAAWGWTYQVSAAAPLALVTFGDSLLAGYGLAASDGFTTQMQRHLNEQGLAVEVINLSVSGNTTADGLTRIDQILAIQPDGVLLALGSNDALRHINPKSSAINIDTMLSTFKDAGIPVLLVGAQAPLNWGLQYKKNFDAIYATIARRHNVPLYPFILDGVALVPDLNQADGVHPNSAGVQMMVRRMGPTVVEFLGSLSE